MEDLRIVQLFWERSEEAVSRAYETYGRYCGSVAMNILSDPSDAEECVNDCMLRAWNSIPPVRPDSLKAYLGRITRNLALDMVEKAAAKKRGGGETALALDELSECVSGGTRPEEELEASETTAAINRFLAGLPEDKRKIFVRRYWYMDSVSDVAKRFGLKEANVKTILFRLRKELAEHLKREGIDV